MGIILLCIGSLKTPWISQGCEEYVRRIGHDADFNMVELPASKQKDPDRQREEECQSMLQALEKRQGSVWVLDETGKEMTSQECASLIGTQKDHGENILIVLGGAYGLNDAVRNRADRCIALSQMTFPHELCRLVLLEQLYRAVQIGKGTGYHH